MNLNEAKEILKKNGYKIENLPGQEYIDAIKKIFPDAIIKKLKDDKTRAVISWTCHPEEPDPAIEWEESTIGFYFTEEGDFNVWIPDWEHMEDDEYIGGEWTALYSPKGIKDYVDSVHKEAEQYKAEIGTEEN